MLWPVTSIARWWARSPRSDWWRPKKVEIWVMALGLQVQDAVLAGRRGGLGGAGLRAVAGLGLVADQAHQVVEEGQLLPHQRAVDAVLAGDLLEQAAQLGAALAGGGGLERRHQRGQALERHGGGRDAQALARAGQQLGAGALQAAAQVHLGLDVAQAGDDALDVLLADRLALGQDRPEQAAAGGDLLLQVLDHLDAQWRGGGNAVRAHRTSSAFTCL